MPLSHHSVFLQAGCPSCHPTNSSVYSGPKFWSPEPRRRVDIFGGMKFFIPFYGIYMPGKFGHQTWSTKVHENSRLYNAESADLTSKTDDRLNWSAQFSPTLLTQLESNVKRSTRSINSIDFRSTKQARRHKHLNAHHWSQWRSLVL